MTSPERYRHWAFTLNNYTKDDLDKLQQLPKGGIYLVYGKEVGDAGTRHLQGFISYSSQRLFNSVSKFFAGRAHVEVARSPRAAAEYCKKDGDYIELGTPPSERSKNQGKRNDLHQLVSAIGEGETDRKRLRTQFPEVCAKYPNFVTNVILDHLPKPKVAIHPLRTWQSSLYKRLCLPPSDREILFIVDKKGNSGKSWFVSYYATVQDNSISILPGKKADMVYAFISLIRENTKVVFLDAPRSKQGDFIQYDFLEELKNGRIFNTKYESRMVEFQPVHVVVMMNEYPDDQKLSEDRYVIDVL